MDHPCRHLAPAVPWKMLRASALGEEEMVNSIDDNTIAKAAKALSFTPALLQARCTTLLAPLQRGAQCDPLTSLALVEAAASVVCDPGCRTTDTPLLNTLLEQLAALGQPLFALFGHPAGEGCGQAGHVLRSARALQR
jgi:DnaJ family protein C protein 13